MSLLRSEPIDPAQLLSEVRRNEDGGLALFVGVVRNHDHGREVSTLEYVAYEPMAEKELLRIERSLAGSHPAARVLLAHRVGRLVVGDVAVVVAASAPHREEAFAACRAGIEAIKTLVPIWKRETGPSGSSWVEGCGDPAHHPDRPPLL